MKKQADEANRECPVCECEAVHADAVGAVRKSVPDDGTTAALAEFFKVFGDSTRMRILFCLDCRELCVCDLAELLGMTKSAISHQLRFLRQSALVTCRRAGKNVFYNLADDHVRDIIEKALEHLGESMIGREERQ